MNIVANPVASSPTAARQPTTASRAAFACRRFLTPLLLLGVASLWSSGAAADPPNADRGRALYENHCEFCHTPQVHSRPNKLPLTRNELRGIVNDWRRQQNLRWSEDDTEDVVEYLNRTRYHFAPETQ